MSDGRRAGGFSGEPNLLNGQEQMLCMAFRKIAQVALLTTEYPVERQPACGEAGDISPHFDRLRWGWLRARWEQLMGPRLASEVQ
jgi:hypothetical protein